MRGPQGWKVNMKMEEWASDMQMREENLDQARRDHSGRIGGLMPGKRS